MLKVLELFGGIGACTKALKRLNIPHKIVDYVEIDKYAVKSYNAINETNFEPQDITKWDKDIDVDLIMHGSPCQDFSIAGSQAGGDEGSGTRSSLMYETIRIVEKLNPKYVVWENVKNVLSKRHVHNFNQYIDYLTKLGYTSYFKVLNAKDYGIPQNRERVFIVSIRKDIDHNMFEFPKPYSLEKRLKDFLEPHVDEKYYLSDKMISYISAPNQKWTGNNNGAFINKDVASTLNTGEGSRRCDASNYVSNDLPDNFDLQNECLNIKEKIKKGYTEAQDGNGVVQKGMIQTIKTSPDIGVIVRDEIKPKLVGGIGDKKSNGGTQYYQQDRIYDSESIAMACPANLPGGSYKYLIKGKLQNQLRIRKLTPKECYRLMGFSDEDFEKSKSVPTSNTQLYKQAGNSIVVNVLEGIFKNLLMKDN